MKYMKLVVVLLAMGWVAWLQLQSLRKLDSLAAEVSRLSLEVSHATSSAKATQEPVVSVTSPPAPSNGSTETGSKAQDVPKPSQNSLSPYIVDSPDVLLIEAVLNDPVTHKAVRLPQQPVSGCFLVRPDGTVGLGTWGSVSVAGLTIDQATEVVHEQLKKQFALKVPGVSPANLVVVVDVQAYNSKPYYVILDDGEKGEQVYRYPCAKSSTVLEALTQVEDLRKNKNRLEVQLARRGNPDQGWHTLTVDWPMITHSDNPNMNYQVIPGDRIYVKLLK